MIIIPLWSGIALIVFNIIGGFLLGWMLTAGTKARDQEFGKLILERKNEM